MSLTSEWFRSKMGDWENDPEFLKESIAYLEGEVAAYRRENLELKKRIEDLEKDND